MIFDIPRDIVLPVRSVKVRLDERPHPFAERHAREIAENWRHETETTPALFNGEVVLLSELVYRDGELTGRCHIVRYDAFLYWRRLRPIPQAGHVYTHAMLVARDNALVAVRMAAHTMNAGLVYFAAGSFEPGDFTGGLADPEVNERREVLEETGIDLGALPREKIWHALSMQSGTVLFRRYRLALGAKEAAERIRDHVAAEADPEIEAPVIVDRPDRPDRAAGRLAPHMPRLIEWHFANPMAI